MDASKLLAHHQPMLNVLYRVSQNSLLQSIFNDVCFLFPVSFMAQIGRDRKPRTTSRGENAPSIWQHSEVMAHAEAEAVNLANCSSGRRLRRLRRQAQANKSMLEPSQSGTECHVPHGVPRVEDRQSEPLLT